MSTGTMPVAGARPATLREQAYGSFTRHLLARDLRPGQFVTQRELVELTGFTLGAIRELIPRLETEGLIQTVRKRGMQIAHVDLKLIRDAFQFRMFMETEAVALYARQAPDGELAALRAAHEEIIAAAEAAEGRGGVPDALVEKAQAVDWRLHETIIDRLGNKIVADAYRVNTIKIRLIRQEQTQLHAGLVRSTMGEHMRVIKAIDAGDPERASDAMREHIRCAERRALDQR